MLTDLLFDAGDEIQGALIWGEVDSRTAQLMAYHEELLTSEEVETDWLHSSVKTIWAQVQEHEEVVDFSSSMRPGYTLCTQVIL